MLQLNPNEILRINKLIDNSLEIIGNNIEYLKKKYTDTKEAEELELANLDTLVKRINKNTRFLDGITSEIIEATGESVDTLLSSDYSLSYFENKLITHYANNIDNDAAKSKLFNIDLCYSKDEKIKNYCQKKNFINYSTSFFQKFNPLQFGLDSETIINDLIYIYDKRGSKEAYAIMRALENNYPQNYSTYSFNPREQIHDNDHYDFNKNVVSKYQVNSEIINVNSYEYEIVQVLPKDCTKTEQLAYDFGKANIINTMRTLPDKYLELCSKGNSNAIILTCARDIMNNNANWSGYYKPSAFLKNDTNSIAIDIHGSFTDNTFYTQDTLIHEMGHKFDDMLQSKNIIDWIFGNTSYTANNSSWSTAYKKYNNVLSGINLGGYISYPNVNEFFGDSTVAYFKNPELFKTLCPEAYNLLSNMLDGEYGYSYDQRIIHVLNATI